MYRWLERLIDRIPRVKRMRSLIKEVMAERDAARAEAESRLRELREHVFIPPGYSSLRSAYDAALAEMREILWGPNLRMSALVTDASEPGAMPSVKIHRIRLIPEPRFVEMVLAHDAPPPIACRLMAEDATRRLTDHLKRTLPDEIVKQMEQQL